MNKRDAGFTLIEIMIVVVIVGIIAAVAFPAYQGSVQKSRRADATATLLGLQLAQTKWRAVNPQYTGTLSDLGAAAATPGGYYNLQITAANATAFTITATPNGDQSSDSCGTFTITQNGPDVSTAAKKTCWNQ